ncbi:SUMO-activating enzyme subunit 1 [Smittium culicis]|uniref:SUMO-activating enzyme subunit 1 n=1 Tax=Smittium culicis TaxID=133412 RepID=A0A1R1XKY2_9FUNG|nr:SUMO-activating enzyme subunit 1 [Smittium culicis]
MTSISNELVNRYDRQIRLWGFEGQRRIITGKMLVVGVTPMIMEMAKNLILGGLGHICVLDNRKVTQINNQGLYILSEEQLGKNAC